MVGRLAVACLVSIGCGRFGFGPGDDDAPPADAAADAAPAVGPVAVVVRDDGAPVQGADVLFHDPDGALLTTVQTDAGGRAVHDVVAGAMVTVVYLGGLDVVPGGGPSYVLRTITGVVPGDEIVFGTAFDPWQDAGEVGVTFPGPVTGATSYHAHTGCDVSSTTDPAIAVAVEFALECAGGGAVSVFAVAYDDAGENVLAYSGVAGIAAPGGQQTPVVLPAWRTAYDELAVELTAPPPGAEVVGIEVDELVAGVAFAGDGDETDDFGPSTILTVDRPQAFATDVGVLAWADFGDGWNGTYRRLIGAPDPLSISLSDGLAEIAAVRADGDPDGRPTIAITALGDLSAADGGSVTARWIAAAETVEWSFIVPPSTTAVRLPALPDFLANLRPGSATAIELEVGFGDADFVDGYDAVRADYGTLTDDSRWPTPMVMRGTWWGGVPD